MAKNYLLREAVEIIAEGTNLEEIADIGKRYPLLAVKLAALSATAGVLFTDFMQNIPDSVTANKVNAKLKESIEEHDEDEDEAEEKPAAKPKEKPKSKPKPKEEDDEDDESEEGDYDSKTSNELYQILKERGLTKGRKFSKKADMIAALVEYDANDGDEEAEDEEDSNDYDELTTIEAYKLCAKRGLKPEQRKSKAYYIEMLMHDDNNEAEAEDGDWDDEEAEEAPKSKSKAKDKPKPETKSKPKSKPKAKDEDDDWTI